MESVGRRRKVLGKKGQRDRVLAHEQLLFRQTCYHSHRPGVARSFPAMDEQQRNVTVRTGCGKKRVRQKNSDIPSVPP